MTMPSGFVRSLFRRAGYLLGPVGIVAGGLKLESAVSTLLKSGWADSRDAIGTGITGIVLGLMITRAAVTGRDLSFGGSPDGEDDERAA